MTLWTLLAVITPLILMTGLALYVGTVLSLAAQALYHALGPLDFGAKMPLNQTGVSTPHTA